MEDIIIFKAKFKGMYRFFFGLLLLFFSNSSLIAQDNNENAIKAVMALQEAAWNRGDIDAFMDGYWKNDSLLFVGSKGPVYGWQKAKERYLSTYPDRAAMGKLAFDLLEIRALSTDYYFMLGHWALVRDTGNIGGTFTLLFRKIDGKWLITTDHTS